MDATQYFFNLRSLTKRDHVIANLKIDIAELKADRVPGPLTDLLIKKKQAELEIELYQRNDFATRCITSNPLSFIKPSVTFPINDYTKDYYNNISTLSTLTRN